MYYFISFFTSSKACSILLAIFLAFSPIQKGKDPLNPQEIERVQDAQQVDMRTKVFLRIAERRLNVILGIAPTTLIQDNNKKENKKENKKNKENKDPEQEESNDYGPEPTGTTAQLLDNYTRVMTELLDKLDDAYENQKNSPIFESAVKKLLEKGQEQLKLLEKISSKVSSDDEERALGKAVETIQTAITGAR
ncbi:MAG: hypothetical protein FD167_2467, partial [bacterium]